MSFAHDYDSSNEPERGPVPSDREIACERAVLIPTLIDTPIALTVLAVGFASGSISMMSEGLRTILGLITSFLAYSVLHSLHRGKFAHYNFGTGAIEQLVKLIVGVMLLASGLWIVATVIGTLLADGSSPEPLDLAIAAVINAVNLCINIYGVWVMVSARSESANVAYRAQLIARVVMLLSSIVAQIVATLGAVLQDPQMVLAVDLIGGAIIAGIILNNGVSAVATSIPDLIDRRPEAGILRRVEAIAAERFGPLDKPNMRARRSGGTIFAELAVTASGGSTDPHQHAVFNAEGDDLYHYDIILHSKSVDEP